MGQAFIRQRFTRFNHLTQQLALDLLDAGMAPIFLKQRKNIVPKLTEADTRVTSSSALDGYAAWKLFDRNDASTWRTDETDLAKFVIWDMGVGNELRLVGFRVQAPILQLDQMATEFSIGWSNDGAAWTTQTFSVTPPAIGVPAWESGERRLFEVDSLTSFRYFRFEITDVDNDDALSQVAGLQLLTYSEKAGDTDIEEEPYELILAANAELNTGSTDGRHHWRLFLKATATDLRIAAATDLQMTNGGRVSLRQSDGGFAGECGSPAFPFYTVVTPEAPMDYVAVVTDRGIGLQIYEQLSDVEPTPGAPPPPDPIYVSSWVVVQRAVSPVTGVVDLQGKAPVFAVHGCFRDDYSAISLIPGEFYVRHFVVREADISAPTYAKSAIYSSEDNRAILPAPNSYIMGFTEDKFITLWFPGSLHTSRYRYDTVMDMLCYTDSGLIADGSSLEIGQVFGEELEGDGGTFTPVRRYYRAMTSHDKTSTGAKYLLLIQNGGAGADVTYQWVDS